MDDGPTALAAVHVATFLRDEEQCRISLVS
jgi:hypothetical protein